MKKYVIITDVTGDMTKEIRERFDIEYIPGHIVFPDMSEHVTHMDWDLITADEFYGSMRKKGVSYKTSPPNAAEFEAAFRKYAAEGTDVLCLTISSGMSGTFQFATLAREEVLKAYPEAKILIVDSLRYSALFGLMAVYASQLRAQGKTIEETYAWLEENKARFHQMGWMDDLRHLARQGRVNNAAAFFGTLVGIKPLGDIAENGMTTVLGKVKGEKKAFAVMLDYIEKTIENPEDQILFMAHTDRKRAAEAFAELLKERFHPKEVILTDVYPACGANIGPGLMAAYYVGKPLSKDLKEEKSLMETLTA